MPQTRPAVQFALSEVFVATSVEARREAVQNLHAALEAYLASDELLSEAHAPEGPRLRTCKQLGEGLAPVSELSDEELRDLNLLLPWAAMTVDQNGRLLGRPWSSSKRDGIDNLLDSRPVAFSEAFPLQDRHVVEMGCFEGVHTLGLLLLGARVTAVDGRMENVLKTMARVWAYGRSCEVRLWNFERQMPGSMPLRWDVLHHIGVLYHLSNPIEHLNEVLPRTDSAVLLDTHIADDGEADQSYDVGGYSYAFRRKGEPHAASAPFAGLRDHAKYLLLTDLVDLLRRHGFVDTRVVSDRQERNGRRVTIWAFRENRLQAD